MENVLLNSNLEQRIESIEAAYEIQAKLIAQLEERSQVQSELIAIQDETIKGQRVTIAEQKALIDFYEEQFKLSVTV